MSVLSLITALSCAVMGGIFLAFSSFVMTALGNVSDEQGITSMQQINIDVFSWSFTSLFMCIPLASIILALYAVLNWSEAGTAYYLAGCVVYLIGTVAVTGKGNIPLNEKLAILDAGSAQAHAVWRGYLRDWTRWNHLRTIACVFASALFFAAGFSSN